MQHQPAPSEIYARLLQHCPPYVQEGPFAGLASPQAFATVADGAAALAALRDEFPQEALVEARVAAPAPDGTLAINPALTAPGGALLAFVAADDAPYEICTAQGCLSQTTLPVLAARRDLVTQTAAAAWEDVFCVAFSMHDVIALRTLGVPAALATGLAELGRKRLRQVAAQFGWQRVSGAPESWFEEVEQSAVGNSKGARRSAPAPESEPADPWPMTLVNWSPAALQPETPEGLEAVWAHFRAIDDYLSFRLDDVYVWRPSSSEVKAIRFSLHYGSPKDVRSAVKESLDGAGGLIGAADPAAARAAPPDYPKALAQYETLCRKGGDPLQKEVAWKTLTEALERDVTGPSSRTLSPRLIRCTAASA